MKIKVSTAEGATLNWMVAKAEGRTIEIVPAEGSWPLYWEGQGNPAYHYSTNWNQGGPIIEREKIRLDIDSETFEWFADNADSIHPWMGKGPTLLIAAMRCYVVSKLGEEVDVPTELL